MVTSRSHDPVFEGSIPRATLIIIILCETLSYKGNTIALHAINEGSIPSNVI